MLSAFEVAKAKVSFPWSRRLANALLLDLYMENQAPSITLGLS